MIKMNEKPDLEEILKTILMKQDLPQEFCKIYGIINAKKEYPLPLEKIREINELKSKISSEDYNLQELEEKISERYERDLRAIKQNIYDLPSAAEANEKQVLRALDMLSAYSAIVSVIPSSEKVANLISSKIKSYTSALENINAEGEKIKADLEKMFENYDTFPFEGKKTKEGRMFMAAMKGFGISTIFCFPFLFYENGFLTFSAFSVFGAFIAGYLAYRKEK